MHDLTVEKIASQLQDADRASYEVLARSLAADTRKGVRTALEAARRRIESDERERERLEGLYRFERELAAEHGGGLVLGLDEVGRGPLAGPLAVGAVVLDPQAAPVSGLNDSKQVRAADRAPMAEALKAAALAWDVQMIEPDEIDAAGISACLVVAFRRAIAAIEAQGVVPAVVLLDGNPLHLDEREVSVVKGDGRCASIAAASVIAKVARDGLMVELDRLHPGYGFASNKGYGSSEHLDAIRRLGLSPAHRSSFCTAFAQESLF